MAEILNGHFHSVYTQEDTGNIPDKGPSPHPSMHDITVNPNGVKKLPKNLKSYKTSEPDGKQTYTLKAATEELAPMLSRRHHELVSKFNVSKNNNTSQTYWQSACLVISPITVDDFAALLNCTPVDLVSDSMMAPT